MPVLKFYGKVALFVYARFVDTRRDLAWSTIEKCLKPIGEVSWAGQACMLSADGGDATLAEFPPPGVYDLLLHAFEGQDAANPLAAAIRIRVTPEGDVRVLTKGNPMYESYSVSIP